MNTVENVKICVSWKYIHMTFNIYITEMRIAQACILMFSQCLLVSLYV